MEHSQASDNEHLPSADIFSTALDKHAPVSDNSSERQRNPAFRITELPPELRDRVYEGLLCPHVDGIQYRCHEKIRDYSLEPSILRSCKQICEEASRVLYTKNSTALIRLDAQAHQLFRKARSEGCPMFPEVFPIAKVECGKVGGEPVLTMEISVLERFRMKPKRAKGKRVKANFVPEDPALFIRFLPALPEICSIACAYEARAMRQLKGGKWNDARDTLQNALKFFDCPRYRLCMERNHRHELEIKKINMQWDYVSCCLKIGRTGDVHHQIRQMFQYCSPQERTPAQQKGYWDRVADAHHAIGMAYVINGAPNSASYSFLQALLNTPGHVQAVRAIDHLEERVKSSSKPEDVMVRLNIECVLKEVRHRGPGEDRLTEDQEKTLVEGFRATYCDFQSLLRDSLVDISIMEPPDAPSFLADDD